MPGAIDPSFYSGGEDPQYVPSIDPTGAGRIYAVGEGPDIVNRQWAYKTGSADPLVAAAPDTRIVLLKVECAAGNADALFNWAGSGGNTILNVRLADMANYAVDNLHLAVPAGEDLDLTISGFIVGCTSWWYTVKELLGAAPVK